MPEVIDFYEHWNKVRIDEHRKRVLHREILTMKFLDKILGPGRKFLDAGCGNGMFLKRLRKRYPESDLYGVDYSHAEVREAKKEGFKVKQADFGVKWPYKNKEMDIVYAGEVIEHLYNPDIFVSEINRILKDKGFFIFSTPNLCAWYNRVLMPLGIQPLFLEPSTKSKLVGSGFLKKFKKDPHPVGHVRIFTLEALKDILRMNGFTIRAVKGANYDEGSPKPLLILDDFFTLFPTMASHFVIVAQKNREASNSSVQ